ncbi:MAG: chemotaxis protein CheW [Xanthomonadales bacterium]|nr:chemotaxis protein CheW [Xanthomonadales bacterium]
MNELPSSLRGVLIQAAGNQLLLPNAAVAEVLSYSDPEPIANAPAWLLGRVRWRGWQVPLVDFSLLDGGAAATQVNAGGRRRVLVVKAPGGHARLPYFAFLADGFPRLMSLSEATLETLAESSVPESCIFARVAINDESAVVPDMDAVESRLRSELPEAA